MQQNYLKSLSSSEPNTPTFHVTNHFTVSSAPQSSSSERCSGGGLVNFIYDACSEIKNIFRRKRDKQAPKYTLYDIPAEYIPAALELIDSSSGIAKFNLNICYGLLQHYYKLMLTETYKARKKHIRQISSSAELLKRSLSSSHSFLSVSQLNDIEAQISNLDNPASVIDYIRAYLVAYSLIDKEYAEKVAELAKSQKLIISENKKTEP